MKRLGQHFLKNKQALKKIVEALELKSGDIVIEIGAGHGELTEVIEHETQNIKREIKIVAIEKDEKLAELLRKRFSVDKNIEIIEGDALKILPQLTKSLKLKAISYKVVGNIPYYITGRLFRVIGELEYKPRSERRSLLRGKPELCVFTIQKEVAERICATPKMNPVRSSPPQGPSGARLRAGATSNGMNRLAASVQFWAEPKIIMRLPKSDFEPPPKVDSAIITLTRTNADLPAKVSEGNLGGQAQTDADNYFAAVRMLFAQPRKTILNNISHGTYHVSREKIMEKLKKTGINPGDRPQNLSVEDIIKIAAAFRF